MSFKLPESVMGGDVSEGAAYGLGALMSGISEECWCATWLTGLEYSCWKAVTDQTEMKFGMGVITERQGALLKMLSDEADGWWVWPDDDRDGPVFLSMSEWIARLAPSPKAP